MAIRIQFDRQWVTLGWALEALALSWLFGRLRHPALAVFTGILYALVGARGAISLIGLLLGFWFVNLEILDFFSVGPATPSMTNTATR